MGLVNRPNDISLSRVNQSQAKFKSAVGGNLLQSWVNLTIELSQSRRLAVAVRAIASAPAAIGRKEKYQAAAEAQPEGDIFKHKKQPADMRKCSAGGMGSVSTDREAQGRDPRTSEDTQPQQGQPGKNAPAAAGRKEEPQTEARTPSGRV